MPNEDKAGNSAESVPQQLSLVETVKKALIEKLEDKAERLADWNGFLGAGEGPCFTDGVLHRHMESNIRAAKASPSKPSPQLSEETYEAPPSPGGGLFNPTNLSRGN